MKDKSHKTEPKGERGGYALMDDLTERIQAFCDEDAGRYNLDHPWVISPLQVAATDRRALVVCQARLYHGRLAEDGAKVPNIASLQADKNDAIGWEAVPEPPPCEQCDSMGQIFHECDDCGYESLERCHNPDCHIKAFGRLFGRAYINQFRTFPDCRWAVAPNGLHADYVFFEFTGGFGLLNRLADGED